MEYEKWAKAKYNEIQANINPCSEDGELDPVRLNYVLTKFGGYFAWAITIQETESNRLNIMQTEYDEWYKAEWSKAERQLREQQGGTKPTLDSTKSRISENNDKEVERKLKALTNQKSRVDLLKGFVRVLEKQASILKTLSSNMRSEFFFAGGVPIGRDLTNQEKTMAAKSIVRKAMKGQSPEDY